MPENQKREVYERVRRAMEAKTGVCTSHKVGRENVSRNTTTQGKKREEPNVLRWNSCVGWCARIGIACPEEWRRVVK